jgi:hypothetical protein
MKYIKTYEKNKLPQYKVGRYIIWYDDEIEDSWEICKIVKNNWPSIAVTTLYCIKDNNLQNYNNENSANIDLLESEEYNCIKYVSDSLEECKEKILLFSIINKYNI